MTLDQIQYLFLYSGCVRRKETMTKKEMIIGVLKSCAEEGDLKNTKRLAFIIADIAHIDQYRDNGRGYIEHPKGCVHLFLKLLSVDGWIENDIMEEYGIPIGTIELAYLHDVVEDTELTHQDIRDIFVELGYGAFFDNYLDTPLKLITHDKSEDYDTYLGKVMEHPTSALVKMLDLSDNMNLFGLGKLGDAELERVIRYAKYFKKINDKYHFLENIRECYPNIVSAWNECRA